MSESFSLTCPASKSVGRRDKIGIIDADLIGKRRKKFPNLACMKLSAFYKELGSDVELVEDYSLIPSYDKVFVSRVFSDTKCPDNLQEITNVQVGGTGFFYDHDHPLPTEVEHHFPDYHLYDGWVERCKASGIRTSWFKDYEDVSVGFTTRGCPRKCDFCVNKHWNGGVVRHSPVSEFVDPTRNRIALCDDNVFAFSGWEDIFDELDASGKKFSFRQGLDIRLLNESGMERLNRSRHEYPIVFAFDKYDDLPIIEPKLQSWMKIRNKNYNALVYVLCAYWSSDIKDVVELFERIRILMRYKCLPYVMRHTNYTSSEFRGLYITIASWCNQQRVFAKKTIREFCQWWVDHGIKNSYAKYLKDFEANHPDVAREFFDMRYPQ